MNTKLKAIWPLPFVAASIIAIVMAVLLVTGSSGEGARYEVTVNFDRSATQQNIDRVGERLRSFDEDADFAIMESFPPIGRAILTVDDADLCASVRAAVEGEPGVGSISCGPYQPSDLAGDPDAPVSNDSSY